MVKCYYCYNDSINRTFIWINEKTNKKTESNINLCNKCNINININYDTFGIPIKYNEEEVINSFIYTDEIDDIYYKYYEASIINL